MTDKPTYQDFKEAWANEMARLVDEQPEADLDDLKREAFDNVLNYQPELDPDISPSEKARLMGYKGD